MPAKAKEYKYYQAPKAAGCSESAKYWTEDTLTIKYIKMIKI